MTFKEPIADFAVSKSRSVRTLALWLLLSSLCAYPILGWTETNWATGQVRTVPLEAIVAGHEGNGAALYACRGGSNEGYRQQVGKFRLGFAGCDFGFGGREIVVSDFQILVTSWQNANSGYVPPNAVEGGDEAPLPGQFGGPPLYYCRGYYDGALTPGKIRPGFTGCNIPFAGKEISLQNYQVMVSLNPKLPLVQVFGTDGSISPDAIRGGTDVNGQPLYLCSGFLDGGLHPGKIQRGWNACDVSYDGSEHWVTSYTVLVPLWEPEYNEGFTFPAGMDIDGKALEVCRGTFQNGVHPGKHKVGSSTCNIGWGGEEVLLTSFDALSGPRPPQ